MGVRLPRYLVESKRVVGERSVSICKKYVTETYRDGCSTGNPESQILSIFRGRQENLFLALGFDIDVFI
jgi:uncharacterized protein (DUF2237 family)